MKIVLVGYMASGKTSLGKLLAKELGLQFIDLDDYIEQVNQMSINEIFQEKGEIYFRKAETQALQQVLKEQTDMVLSIGGGTPCYGNNMEIILEHSDHSIYLKLSIPGLVNRIKNEKEKRPLVSHLEDHELMEFIGKHLFERSPFYNQAKKVISVEEKDLDALVQEIMLLLL